MGNISYNATEERQVTQATTYSDTFQYGSEATLLFYSKPPPPFETFLQLIATQHLEKLQHQQI